MDIFPSEDLQVTKQSAQEVVVWDPPFYSFGVIVFVLAGMLGLVSLVSVICRWPMQGIVLMSSLAGALCVLGFYLRSSHNTITLSKSRGLLELTHDAFGKGRSRQEWSLANVKEIKVDYVQHNRRILLVLKTGETSVLGTGSNRDGYEGVVKAMNDFLKTS